MNAAKHHVESHPPRRDPAARFPATRMLAAVASAPVMGVMVAFVLPVSPAWARGSADCQVRQQHSFASLPTGESRSLCRYRGKEVQSFGTGVDTGQREFVCAVERLLADKPAG